MTGHGTDTDISSVSDVSTISLCARSLPIGREPSGKFLGPHKIALEPVPLTESVEGESIAKATEIAPESPLIESREGEDKTEYGDRAPAL